MRYINNRITDKIIRKWCNESLVHGDSSHQIAGLHRRWGRPSLELMFERGFRDDFRPNKTTISELACLVHEGVENELSAQDLFGQVDNCLSGSLWSYRKGIHVKICRIFNMRQMYKKSWDYYELLGDPITRYLANDPYWLENLFNVNISGQQFKDPNCLLIGPLISGGDFLTRKADEAEVLVFINGTMGRLNRVLSPESMKPKKIINFVRSTGRQWSDIKDVLCIRKDIEFEEIYEESADRNSDHSTPVILDSLSSAYRFNALQPLILILAEMGLKPLVAGMDLFMSNRTSRENVDVSYKCGSYGTALKKSFVLHDPAMNFLALEYFRNCGLFEFESNVQPILDLGLNKYLECFG